MGALLNAFQIGVGSQIPQYGTMLASEVCEDKGSHESLIKPRSENEEVFLQATRKTRFAHSRTSSRWRSNSCRTRPQRISGQLECVLTYFRSVIEAAQVCCVTSGLCGILEAPSTSSFASTSM
ncbi:hypothetical protein PRNP1_001466 [Phytophthora ramorum]